jgi:hypothetical protein
MLALWLDEEWTPLEVHARVGAAAAEAYGELRTGGGGGGGGGVGEAETSDVLLGLGSALLSVDFRWGIFLLVVGGAAFCVVCMTGWKKTSPK